MKDTTIDEILKQRSIYPECERKTYEERKQELTYWKETYGEVLWAYNLYGMDRKDSAPIDDWLDYGNYARTRYRINATFIPDRSPFPYAYTPITRDKLLTEAFVHFFAGEKNAKAVLCSALQ